MPKERIHDLPAMMAEPQNVLYPADVKAKKVVNEMTVIDESKARTLRRCRTQARTESPTMPLPTQ